MQKAPLDNGCDRIGLDVFNHAVADVNERTAMHRAFAARAGNDFQFAARSIAAGLVHFISSSGSLSAHAHRAVCHRQRSRERVAPPQPTIMFIIINNAMRARDFRRGIIAQRFGTISAC